MMHMKTILRTLPVLLLAACSGGGSATLEVQVDGGAGRTLYLDRYENNRPVHLDSIVLDAQGHGSIPVPSVPLDFYRLAFDDEDQVVLAFDSTASISLTATAGELLTTARVQGSPHSVAMVDYVQVSDSLQRRIQDLRQQMASDPGDGSLLDQLNGLNQDLIALSKKTIDDNPGSPVQYFAVTKLNAQEERDYYTTVRDQLRTPMAASSIYQGYSAAVDRMLKQLEAMQAQEERQRELERMLPVGGEAPDFSQQTPDGRTIALSDLRGQVVLIDFWASWCKPCRIENPNVKRVYDKYHTKGFEILGVSLDRSKQAWEQAIAQDDLPWKHVSDLGFWNNAAAQQYGVSSIPFTVLVDRDGTILAKGLRGAALEQKLAEVLGS